jgi:ABC-type Co2+ transport system permease subunit
MKKLSSFFSWTWFDVLKGAITSALTAASTALLQYLNVGHIPTTAEGRVILIAAAAAFVGYMLKNLFSNSKGQPFKANRSKQFLYA